MKRQGDLLIKPIDQLPKGLKKVMSGVILRGEATGHAHRLSGGSLLSDGTNMYLSVENVAQILHEEHKPISLSKGSYAVIRQREYLSSDMTKVVVD